MAVALAVGEGEFKTSRSLSLPAKAGNPGLRRQCGDTEERGVLDTPPSRGMTAVFVAVAVHPSSFAEEASTLSDDRCAVASG
uniref:Uncharacterized protein n=1 Tax=Bradyrhizobium amphicarpaeae TaxID=1404768 RepID=A0A2U8PRD5_9BRAD|nr:hypothetical protein CIT40_09800 [Bradyrhizobium amphicarpaeae]